MDVLFIIIALVFVAFLIWKWGCPGLPKTHSNYSNPIIPEENFPEEIDEMEEMFMPELEEVKSIAETVNSDEVSPSMYDMLSIVVSILRANVTSFDNNDIHNMARVNRNLADSLEAIIAKHSNSRI